MKINRNLNSYMREAKGLYKKTKIPKSEENLKAIILDEETEKTFAFIMDSPKVDKIINSLQTEENAIRLVNLISFPETGDMQKIQQYRKTLKKEYRWNVSGQKFLKTLQEDLASSDIESSLDEFNKFNKAIKLCPRKPELKSRAQELFNMTTYNRLQNLIQYLTNNKIASKIASKK